MPSFVSLPFFKLLGLREPEQLLHIVGALSLVCPDVASSVHLSILYNLYCRNEIFKFLVYRETFNSIFIWKTIWVKVTFAHGKLIFSILLFRLLFCPVGLFSHSPSCSVYPSIPFSIYILHSVCRTEYVTSHLATRAFIKKSYIVLLSRVTSFCLLLYPLECINLSHCDKCDAF